MLRGWVGRYVLFLELGQLPIFENHMFSRDRVILANLELGFAFTLLLVLSVCIEKTSALG